MAKFVISKKKVIEQYEKVKVLADYVSYSSKTNQVVTKVLEENTDSLFSVHFFNELKHVKDMGRVIFLAQGWNGEEIEKLVCMGIRSYIVDNEKDLDVLVAFLKKNKIKVNLMLRLRLKENTIKTEKYFVFGMKADVVNRRIRGLRDNEKIGELGVHFHRKTQNMAEWNLTYEVGNILEEDVLRKLDVLNIGGGLPAKYANVNIDVLNSIVKRLDEFKEFLRERNIKLMIEPGRFIAAPTGKLITNIISIYDDNIIVDASVYNSDLDALIVSVKLCVEGELSKDEGEPYVIKGITPCSLDLFRYRVYLKNPQIGDKMVFLNAGAYNFSSDFCDLEKLETEIVEDFD
jgi:ornithine decarboxylase